MNLQVGLFTAGIGIALGAILTAFDIGLEGGAIAVLSLAPLYIRMDRRCVPSLLIGPSIFVYMYHLLGYVIGPIAQRYLLGFENFIEAGMVMGQWGAVIGLTTYLIVFPKIFRVSCRWVNRNKTQRTEIAYDSDKLPGYTLLLLVLSISILLFGYITGGSRRIGGPPIDISLAIFTTIYSFWNVQFIVFFFLGFLAVKLRGAWTVLWIFCFFSYGVFYALEGSRGPVFFALILSVVGAHLAGFSARKVLFVVGLFFFVLVPLSGIVETYRSNTMFTSLYDKGFMGRVTGFWEASQELKWLDRHRQKYKHQAFIFAITATTVDRIMELTPGSIPYAGLENLSAMFYSFIPKIILPNRPEIADSDSIAYRYGVGPGDNTSHTYIPSVGEGYRRFSWPGIPLIYALNGVIYGFWIGICWGNRYRREWQAMLIFLVFSAAGVWSFTFNSMFYFATFVSLKYIILLSLFRIMQDRWRKSRII